MIPEDTRFEESVVCEGAFYANAFEEVYGIVELALSVTVTLIV